MMNKRVSMLVGTFLILMGGLMLVSNVMLPLLGIRSWYWRVWRLWPSLVVGVGAFFIFGAPILATGGVLLFTSVFNVWGA